MAAYDILLFYEQFTTIGLAENMVYDIIPVVPAAVGNTTVNASVFEVQCAALPYANQTSQPTLNTTSTATELSVFRITPDGPEATFPLACVSPCLCSRPWADTP